MSESSLHNQKYREKIAQIAFEKLQVPNLYIVKSAVLSAFSSGRSNALILDSGAQITTASPVFEGFTLQKNIQKFDFGGETVTQVMQEYIERCAGKKIVPQFEISGASPTTTTSLREFFVRDLVRNIKEGFCQLDEKSQGEVAYQETFDCELPDGTQVNLDKAYRSEILHFQFHREIKPENFQPVSLQVPELNHFKGIQHMIFDSINSCDIDIRKELFQNIILCGGNTTISGFQSRVHQKLVEMVPNTQKVKLISYPSPTEKKFSSWIGGSILASLGSFQSMWITKKEY